MSHNKQAMTGIGMCSLIIGSSTLAIKAQKALTRNGISASVSKSTTSVGCVYTVNFSCVFRAAAEEILNSQGIKIKGYL